MAYKALEIEPKVVQKVSKHEVIYESQRLVGGGGGDDRNRQRMRTTVVSECCSCRVTPFTSSCDLGHISYSNPPTPPAIFFRRGGHGGLDPQSAPH